MKVSEAIKRADALRMNTVSDEQKAAWVLDLDGQLALNLLPTTGRKRTAFCLCPLRTRKSTNCT